MSTTTLLTSTIHEISERIRSRELSPTELLERQLKRIEALDGNLRSFVRVTANAARRQAATAEQEIAAGRYRGPLHGIPIGLKDLIYTKSVPTTCASRVLGDFTPDFDATIVEKLEAAGAVFVGKLNLTEFALYGYHPDLPHPRNPWNAAYHAGASSSGSAAAVAGSLCFGAIGTDTGGSIRFPSAACGIVGIKPTFGKVSRFGVFPLADSLDHVGPMARCVADAAIILQILEGRDPRDPSTRDDPVIPYLSQKSVGVSGLRIGIDRRYCTVDTEDPLTNAALQALDVYRRLGAAIVDVDLTGLDAVGHMWVLTCAVEALLHHRKFYKNRPGDYGPAFRALLDYGSKVSAEDYARAQILRQQTSTLLNAALSKADCLIFPAAPQPPAPIDALPPDAVIPPEFIGPAMRYTAPMNFSGHPSITLPNGFAATGLPLAMQIVGRHGGEATIIAAARAYEAATDWHKQRPPL